MVLYKLCGTHSKIRKQNSKEPHLQILSNPKPQNSQTVVKNLTDVELIRCCVENGSSDIYWKAFYQRFNRLIDKRILKTLLYVGIPLNAVTQDLTDEISFILIEKIHGKKLFKKALNHTNFRAWLLTVVRNVVLDWNRAKKSQKNAFAYAMEIGKKSLEEPIGSDEKSARLVDTISAPEEFDLPDGKIQKTHHYDTLLRAVKNLPDIQRLVLKVKMMFYISLEKEEILEIASMRSVSPLKISREVDAILSSLEKKNEKYEHQQNMIAIKFTFLERLHYKFYEMEKNLNTSPNKLKELKKEIAEKTKQLEKMRNMSQKINVYPTAGEIAQLLGIAKAKQKNIGIWLYRARKTLNHIEL
ncbi:MAG: hypothetical protein EHM85_11895 [Desulfobacteraceae bacterium]|nr:MAG: hypothetical protein EHM85_11895 [Desulfobacteraceae bacterium]